jgi:hypothetical protein
MLEGGQTQPTIKEWHHAPIQVDELIGTDLGHHVTGAVVAVGIENRGGDFRSFVVAGEQILVLTSSSPAGTFRAVW